LGYDELQRKASDSSIEGGMLYQNFVKWFGVEELDGDLVFLFFLTVKASIIYFLA
jgi:hypothetical protein